MPLIYEDRARKEALREVAKRMMTAARTAPKGHGTDNLIIAVAERDVIETIAAKMKDMVRTGDAAAFFNRDADNILRSDFLVLIGTKIKPLGLKNCGLCGFKDCEEKLEYLNHPCAFNTGDLGIAIGSAAGVAADARVDNRVMFSVGKAVRALNLLGDEAKIIYGIPLSATGKNPFFDRK
ncbi:MAG: ferredoxin [Clostridiales bacterium]|nr:ferredoxin [Clostridiales bacterium]